MRGVLGSGAYRHEAMRSPGELQPGIGTPGRPLPEKR